MAHTAAALSDTTSVVTSPTPFSPFSSAYSVSSEATVVSEGQADLGAFQSVFFALSQLQLHHQHHPRSPHPNNALATTTGGTSTSTGPTPPRRHDDSTDDDDHDDDDDDHDTDHGFTTPSLYPVSPLNLDGTVSRSSIHPSTNPPSRAQLTHASEGSTDEAVASDIILAAGGASSGEGDEESIALASPPSQPSSSSASDSASDVYPAPTAPTFEDDDGGRWMFAESPYDPAFRPSASSEDSDLSPRPQQTDEVSAQVDEGTSTSPSLGDMEAAFAFFAAERAKLVKQLEANKSGTPSTLAPSLPLSGNNRKNNSTGNSKRGGGGGKAHRKNKSSESGPRSRNSDEASLDPSPTPGASPSAAVTLSSSSPDDQIPDARRNQRRNGGGGLFPRAPKQNLNKSMRNGSSSNVSLAAALLSQSIQSHSQFPPSNKQPRNRPSHHRHSRSLPIDSQTIASIHQQLQLPTATTLAPSPLAQSVSASGSGNPDEAEKIRQLARKLTFQFPFDTPSLRRVMQNPQGVMGLRSHATPGSDEVLVAEGFFDPVYASAGGSSVNNNINSALLHVFIDHSNILVGFLEWMKKQGVINKQQQLTVGGGKPKMSLPALALLLERGRRCLRKVLVASSPLYQSLDEMAGMGYQISVLQRVEIKEGSSAAARKGGRGHSRSSSFNSLPTTNSSAPNRKNGKGKGNLNPSPTKNNNSNNNNNAGSSTESESNNTSQQRRNNSGNSNNSGSPGNTQVQPSFAARLVNSRRGGGHHRRNSSTDVASFMTPSNSSTSLSQIQEGSGGTASSGHSTPGNNGVRPRFREEAVDELLQLKLLQTLLDGPSPPPPGSTIVLASGDAAKSQFNPEGFLGCVRKAVERGWNVEVVGWDEGRSRAYAELQNEIVMDAQRGVHQGGMLDIISLDKWGMDLLENPPVVVHVN